MELDQARNKLALVSLLVLVVGAAIVVLTWAYPKPNPAQTLLDPSAYKVNGPNRAPSSIISLSNTVATKPLEHSKMLTLQLPCEEFKNHFTSMARQIRITGSYCKNSDVKGDIHIRIFNSTNKYEASIFNMGKRGYSTDYIYLSDGDNVITIEKATDNSVLSVSKFIVKRMVASKESEGL